MSKNNIDYKSSETKVYLKMKFTLKLDVLLQQISTHIWSFKPWLDFCQTIDWLLLCLVGKIALKNYKVLKSSRGIDNNC